MSKETEKTKEKLDGGLIEDQYSAIQRAVHAMAVLRDGIREADGEQELRVWQNVADMLLESEVLNVDEALQELSEIFSDLEYTPVYMSPYSLLRDSRCDCHKTMRQGKV